MLLLCCFGFLLYIHYVLAINYKPFNPHSLCFVDFLRYVSNDIHGSPGFIVLKQKSKGQHLVTQSLVILDYLEIGRTSVTWWRFCRKLQLSTYILHNKYRNNKRLLLDSGMILICRIKIFMLLYRTSLTRYV